MKSGPGASPSASTIVGNSATGRDVPLSDSAVSNCPESTLLIEWDMTYADIITIEPGKRGGKPCIRGLRITVYDVLEYLASGMSHAEVLQEFPYLTEEDIRGCLAYAADRERKVQILRV